MKKDATDPKPEESRYWLDDSRNVKKVVVAVYTVCGLLFLADALYTKHPHFDIEGWFGFYAIYGFVSCVGLVLAAKRLRQVVKRKEDYYDG